MGDEETIDVKKASPKKDIRKYLCQYCGITRSKKYLINSHIESHHKMEVEDENDDEACEVDEDSSKKLTCQECAAVFKKPAHLKQHMQSHSLERLFECYVEGCDASYRRKDHLNRHILTHKGKLFKCQVENCKSEFSCQSNLSIHVKRFHSNGDIHEDSTGSNGDSQPSESSTSQKLFKCPVQSCKSKFSVQANLMKHIKKLHSNGDNGKDCTGGGGDSGNGDSQPSECSSGQNVCKEIGCGKAFKYASQLQHHQESHVKLDSVEAFCSEAGCMKYFTNEECLKAHVRSCHQHINCEICGSKQLKKNIKRHLKTHDKDSSPEEEFRCDVEGCSSTFSKASNLKKHVKAVHEDIRPFVCGFPDCGMRFAYKHVRNNHENSASHAYTCGDFVETDEVFTSRPRGGVKRKQVTAEEMLIRKKRVMPPQFDSEGHETC